MPEFMPIFMSAEALGALAGVLFPLTLTATESAESSGASTPLGEETENMIVLPKTPTEDGSLTSHPVRQFIIDFIRVIAVDSLSLSVTGKASPVIDLVKLPFIQYRPVF